MFDLIFHDSDHARGLNLNLNTEFLLILELIWNLYLLLLLYRSENPPTFP